MSVFIIAEAGSNWFAGEVPSEGAGTLQFARAWALIEAAAEAGADACKFQVFSSASVYAPQAGAFENLGDVNALFKKLEMPKEWLPDLAAHCAKHEVEFMASVFSIEDLRAVNPFVRRHKIASYELGHRELIKAALDTGKEVIVSTGAATAEEVERLTFAFPTARLRMLHCVAAYPAPAEELRLGIIRACSCQDVTDYDGYSDHSLDPVVAPLLAVALGAEIIEKHFTLSRKLCGPDHAFALEPAELKEMVRAIRLAESMLGDDDGKCVMPCEEKLRRFAVRTVQATRNIGRGDAFTRDNIAVLRPGNREPGAHGEDFERVLGRRAVCDIAAGDGVTLKDTL